MASKNRFYTLPYGSEIVESLQTYGYDQLQDAVEEHTAELHIIVNRHDGLFWLVDTENLDHVKLMAEDDGEVLKTTTLNDIMSWQN